MSQDLLETLRNNPQEIFELYKPKESDETSSQNIFNEMTKTFLDPFTKKYSVLDEIYVDGLDSSQVFGQTKMVLDGVGETLLASVIPELKEKYGVAQESEPEDEEDSSSDEEGEFEEKEEENDELEAEQSLDEDQKDEDQEDEDQKDDEEEEEQDIPVKKDVFGLNDEFFDIDEYNKQVMKLEEAAENDDYDEKEEEIDYFAALSDEDEEEEEEEMAYYDDFYDKPGKEEEEEEEEGDFSEGEIDNAMGSAMLDLFADEVDNEEVSSKNEKTMSSFEKQQQQIQAEIAKLEAELVADKKWTMKGEVGSKDRPQDSLLDDPESANMAFDRTSKPVPIVTQESTEALEDLIRRRIREEQFDEVPKRLVADVARFHNKQKFELSEQKSSKSLSEMYEDQYKNVDTEKEVSEEIQKQHDEITELFTKVSHRLDALCSAHFIPKPHQFKTIEIKVSDNAASINMEDAQPLHVSSESTLAPQEIYKIGDDKPVANGAKGRSEVQLKSGLSFSKDELSREDKQRLRRANKRKRAKEFNQRKELQEQKQKQTGAAPANKRQKVGEVINTLSKAKNITVIGKKGEMRDVKGNVKKSQGAQTSNNFKL
ncbi:predicted protein [Scheffersomyces stipitis CBS 6054]|uniref:U3 small nucleolar ribonucleoprotein protein MPP10 n=1 Tax=Scheffersomyces stipitis (strain ATCC 58785 / CBS 6054 / NBRC 10063 / NRRL Y-11545) TaxID=322104 RepID=A3LN05_PICST|nr:predicted protein [Scheffersomyces stipitis CBS 6054]ABN64245.2 predicted protein [Scheffersomyces stipitis CBS 6054]